MSLSNKAMLVRLSISQWSARKYDSNVTDKVKSDYNAHGEVGRFNKLLATAPTIKKISQIASDARAYHYAHTLPWEDEGIRVLPTEEFFEYSSKMREHGDKYRAEVEDLVAAWPDILEDAKNRLNGMFKESDYPRPAELRTKYDFNMSVSPIMEASDFRVALPDAELAQIQRDIEERLTNATQEAMRDIWNRLYEAVEHIGERLNTQTKGKESVFRDSLIENARELVELLPRLNITGDADLEKMRKEVKERICVANPDMLRASKTIRKQTANAADDIMRKMKGYMG